MRTWLRSRREELGISAKQAAKKLDISESYYSLIERGERQKTLDYSLVVKLSQLLKMPISKIAKYESGDLPNKTTECAL